MSLALFHLAGVLARRRGLVLAGWLLLLALLVGGAGALGDDFDDSVAIPGTESQQGQDVLSDRFGLTGAAGQVLISTGSGRLTDATTSTDVSDLVARTDAVDGVSVSDPLDADDPLLSDDGRSTIAQLRFDDQVPSAQVLDAVAAAAEPKPGSPLTTYVGGDAYKADNDPSRLPELLGLMVSFLILAVTFGSLVAAGMPILSSLVGVGVTLSSVVLVSSWATVSSNAPTLAEMLGLAVGIDYALFILSRYRRHLGEGLATTEAMARALATAGSAVVFAGATVVIALAGLAVADIPVLTVMGLAAAGAVSVAVLAALTLIPALALLLGERLRPRPPRERTRRSGRSRQPRRGVAGPWVRAVTRVPMLTVAAVLVLLGLVAVPAAGMRLALPDNSTAPPGTSARETYDAITRTFGEGYNSPLSVAVDVIASTDPSGAVDDLADDIAAVPDVVDITMATPNPGGDTGLVQVVPREGQTAASTSELVRALRAAAPGWEDDLGVSQILVTGQTAINIDVSERLGVALVPFAAIVIGLSLLLLTVVFRSVAVPLKATLGYLLSVGAALGAVVAVFQWGWFSGLLGEAPGPIVSFLPIFVMGVLFGLAMDYEMFLVSAMREEYVATGDARGAVEQGFRASARVVTAAALIMTSVFVAFIPSGSATIKPIALGLAVGVFVDAFVVRMTLVPAVLVLLGRGAWWLPGWLERRLPEVDVEGAALHRKVAVESWQDEHGTVALLARGLVVQGSEEPLRLEVPPGRVRRLDVAPGAGRATAYVLGGRGHQQAGELVVAGLLLPEQRAAAQPLVAVIEPTDGVGHDSTPAAVAARVRLLSSSRRRRRELSAAATTLTASLTARVHPPPAWRGAVVEAGLALASGVRVVVLVAPAPRRALPSLGALAQALADEGVAVVVVAEGATPVTERAPQEREAHAGEVFA